MTITTTAGSDVLLRDGAAALGRCGIPSSRRESRLLLAHALGVLADELLTARFAVPEAKVRLFETLISRRCQHEPLAYIVGVREFWSLDFHVGPGVLIPRPESETLIEAALSRCDHGPHRVLDLGTGSGCLLLAFLSEKPNATGLGVDGSETALAMATVNARALQLEGRAMFRLSNWTDSVSGQFDVIFANPPYVRSSDLVGLAADVARFEPVEALDGGMDGLDAYRAIAAAMPKVTTPSARIFLEIGYGQADQVPPIFASSGFRHEGTICDLGGIPRCVLLHSNEGA